jgi:5-methyltetrahydrofolate--homocysteine methyltransferase
VKKLLHEAVLERRLVCDGAMGTQLMLAGLEPGGCGERWNLSHPEKVLAIHHGYVEAGAECLITNTFGGSRTMLARHGHENNVREINRAAVGIAREAFGDRDGYVLGDVGPLGGILEPYGDITVQEAEYAYGEQAAALVEAGVDAIMIETQTSLEELAVAIKAARDAGALSIIASLAYDLSANKTFYVTMMGVLPDRAAKFVEECGADILALNCGTGMDMFGAAKVIRLYRENCKLPTMAQPNAGLPVLENGKAVYKQTPLEMAAGVPDVLAAGANIIGSCCGSNPDHTRVIRAAVGKFRKEVA